MDATVVLLAFGVVFTVFEKYALALGIFFPVVAVVGVEVTFIEAEFGQENGVTGELIIVVQEGDGTIVYHDKEIKIVRVVAETHLSGLFGAEVVRALFERIPKDTVTACRPVEWGRRAYTTVGPAIGVLYGYLLAAVGETSVLHAATIEVFALVGTERQCHFAFFESGGGCFFKNGASRRRVRDAYAAVRLVDGDGGLAGGEDVGAVAFVHVKRGDRLARLIDEDLGLGLGLRVAWNTALRVAEKADNVLAVEVELDALAVGQNNFG